MARGGFAVARHLPSTHLLGRRIAREYCQDNAAPPTIDLLAWQQTAGEGRQGRPWRSPPGGVYATLIRPLASGAGDAGDAPMKAVQTLPLLVATALCEALNVDLAGRCRLKWPNDLMVGGRKLGGILIDAACRGGGAASTVLSVAGLSGPGLGRLGLGRPGLPRPGLAVISFGVNHGRVDQAGATSIEHEAPGRTRLAELVVRLIEAVDAALERGAQAAEVVDRYRRLSLHKPGDALHCRLRGDSVEGVFRGFDQHGFLRLLVGGEERLLAAGEIVGDA
jgi:BirA family transcriptional regulator, biotin operon repressor / biotin---[acetyl-CoA-carboxylase] ligase